MIQIYVWPQKNCVRKRVEVRLSPLLKKYAYLRRLEGLLRAFYNLRGGGMLTTVCELKRVSPRRDLSLMSTGRSRTR